MLKLEVPVKKTYTLTDAICSLTLQIDRSCLLRYTLYLDCRIYSMSINAYI